MRENEEKSIRFLSKNSLSIAAIATLLGASIANATVETGWTVGTPNTCKNSTDIFIDFEGGIDATEVKSSNPNLEFTNTSGLDWQYLDFTTHKYNTSYIMNGNTTTWLGVSGNAGRITFKGGTGSYLSLLTKTSSGLEMDAYDADGNHLANSGRAGGNLYSGTMTRLTVEADNISYVEIHDSGNYWTVDDICTDAAAVVQPVPGHTNGDSDERIDLVFVMDKDYIDGFDAFLKAVEHQISDRLGGIAPVDTNLDKFNFYYTRLEGDVIDNDNNKEADNCGDASSLPDKLLEQCTFENAVVVLHTQDLSDCKSTIGEVSVFSAEGNADRSFIHEAGHALFGLKDEYDSNRSATPSCKYTNYTDGGTPSNIWATETDCRNDARDQGWDEDQCYMFTPCQEDWWKLGDPSLADNDAKYKDNDYKFIMRDGSHFSNGWGDASARRINWVFNNLTSSTGGGWERSIILDFNINENGMTLLDTKYSLSKAPNYLPESKDLEARLFSNNGSLLGKFSINDPRIIEGEPGYTGPNFIDSKDFKVILPLPSTIKKVEIIEESSGKSLAVADLTSYATKQAPRGDLNDDGIVDRNDVNIINDYRNQPASNNPGCDIDNDGTITIYDARNIIRLCTYPRCSSN
jgi:hypothetical protein